jgi:hypothetical protein
MIKTGAKWMAAAASLVCCLGGSEWTCRNGAPARSPVAGDAVAPRINGPSVYGARPGHPFLYRIPATGQRPMVFSAAGLPPGLELDAVAGIITGAASARGASTVTLRAQNAAGTAERKLRIVIGDQLALTPPMGWSSWYILQSEVSDQAVRAQADALVSSGLADHGYSYINIDDGWSHRSAAVPPNVSIVRVIPAPLTADEQYTHMSLWSLLAAPLIVGSDLTKLDTFTLSLLTNDEVIEVDQDPLGKAARRVRLEPELSIWVRDLEDGSKAVGLFNLGEKEKNIAAAWSEVGISGAHAVRDLWARKNLGTFERVFQTRVPPHGVALLRISRGALRE